MLSVVEVFATLQGEGSLAGSPAVFIRLAGCNLWSGREHERDKGRGECAGWCDTVFHTGDRMSLSDVIERIGEARHMNEITDPLLVFTGGEPTLQLRRPEGLALLRECRDRGFRCALETNGTNALGEMRELLHHVTVSPKPMRDGPGLDHVLVRKGTDLKVIVPTPFGDDELNKLSLGFDHAFFQPMDIGDSGKAAVDTAISMANRLNWRVSVQTHKHLGLP